MYVYCCIIAKYIDGKNYVAADALSRVTPTKENDIFKQKIKTITTYIYPRTIKSM